ncbi:hypothetical protein ABZ891_37275 [Streptomyces sp. NPDC047023]|uniref:DUF6247 family protein n=1 Tax=Streptomyces sp. NPDC047023 TaxID=3155139 RepID=UPI0034024578
MNVSADRPPNGDGPRSIATAEELRAALGRLAPDAVAAFDSDYTAVLARTRDEASAAPMRRFLRRWSLTIAIERQPALAARLRHLQEHAGQVAGAAEGRPLSAEIGHLLDEAAADAGPARHRRHARRR